MGHRAMPRARRLTGILDLLRLQPRTSQELAERFGVDIRTIQRDFELLRQSGEALESVGGDRYALPSLVAPLTAAEALAVYSAARLLYHHSPAPQRPYVLAMEKLATLLPWDVREVLMHSALPAGEWRSADGRLEEVFRGWLERRVLAFDEHAPNKKVQKRKLEVHFLEVGPLDLDWHVLGRDPEQNLRRTFKLSCMQNIKRLPDIYQIPQDFDPRHVLNPAWGVVGVSDGEGLEVRLKFRREAAGRVREGEFPGLKVKEVLEDGAVLASLTVGTKGDGIPVEVLSFVQGWGSRVEVLSPPDVRERWLAEAREVADFARTSVDP